MTKSPTPKQITDANKICGEMFDRFGPPPLLPYENKKTFHDFLYGLVIDYMPFGYTEQMLVWEAASEAWEVMRDRRHKMLFMERHVRLRKEELPGKIEETRKKLERSGETAEAAH